MLILILVLVSACTTSPNYDVSEYVNEFSNEGEKCEAIDIFQYDAYDPKLWNKNRYSKTIPVFYNCCEDSDCITIIVDLDGKRLMKDGYYQELIDLNYIKHSMNNGSLNKTSFVSKGFDSCQYHGKDKLNEESLNLVADNAEKIASAQKSKDAKKVVKVVKTAKSLNVVSPFNLADFGLSVACNYNDEKLKVAVEKITECNLYLSNIQKNYARTGYVPTLETCLDSARANFKEYIDLYLAKVKHVADKTFNILSAIWNLLQYSANPTSNIEKTDYEIARDIYHEIEDKKLYLRNPDKADIFNKYKQRVSQKQADYDRLRLGVESAFTIADNNKPSSVKVFFSDLFKEPNYNLSEANSLYKNTKKTQKLCESMHSEVKFNSAIKCMDDLEERYKSSNEVFERENKILRSFDNTWKYVLILIILPIAVFLALRYIKRDFLSF